MSYKAGLRSPSQKSPVLRPFRSHSPRIAAAARVTDSEVILSFTNVTKTIAKIGNSQGIIFDVALMDLTRLKVGDQLVVTVHDGGTITLTPVQPAIEAERAGATAKRLIGKNEELFRRLS